MENRAAPTAGHNQQATPRAGSPSRRPAASDGPYRGQQADLLSDPLARIDRTFSLRSNVPSWPGHTDPTPGVSAAARFSKAAVLHPIPALGASPLVRWYCRGLGTGGSAAGGRRQNQYLSRRQHHALPGVALPRPRGHGPGAAGSRPNAGAGPRDGAEPALAAERSPRGGEAPRQASERRTSRPGGSNCSCAASAGTWRAERSPLPSMLATRKSPGRSLCGRTAYPTPGLWSTWTSG